VNRVKYLRSSYYFSEQKRCSRDVKKFLRWKTSRTACYVYRKRISGTRRGSEREKRTEESVERFVGQVRRLWHIDSSPTGTGPPRARSPRGREEKNKFVPEVRSDDLFAGRGDPRKSLYEDGFRTTLNVVQHITTRLIYVLCQTIQCRERIILNRYRRVKKDPWHFIFHCFSTDRAYFTVQCIVFLILWLRRTYVFHYQR